MLRLAAILLSVASIALVSAEVLGLAVLWHRGYLTAETLHDVRVALTGESADESESEDEAPEVQPGLQNVVRERALRILQLDSRASELDLLKNTTAEMANRLIAERQAFDTLQRQFEERLQQLQQQAADESTAQAQAVLLALPPAVAVERLMGLPLEENVVLLKGMPEKSIAKILVEFQGDAVRTERGQKIFEALSRGEPERSLIDATIDNAAQQAAARTGTAG